MDIQPRIINEGFTKPQIEAIEQEQDEYKLIGKYRRTKGLRLFAYNYLKDQLFEVAVNDKDEAEISFVNGQAQVNELATEEATVDSRDIHFEALNRKSAEKRLRKYKAGKIKELCNLKDINPDGIKFW